ncbi:hypothetical protein ES703_113122 [subsurface metagenome]
MGGYVKMLPTGIIVLWYGSIVSIPDGWILCDGTGGSPDLQDKFIVGAGNTYAVDDTGGNVNHTHAFTGDGHQHTLGGGPVIATGTDRAALTSSSNAVGTTDNGNGLPPYHALAYIMKT